MPQPFVTIVLPVLNVEKILPRCLDSVRAQDYPPDRYEIIMADGGSTDATRNMAESYGAVLLDNPERRAEPGKQLAFAHTQGEYIVFIDADNEIANPDWLSRAVNALERHPDALGFESYYLKKPGDNHLNRYLTGLLQISDPIARSMAGRVRRIQTDPDGAEVLQLPADGAYPTGANGFIFHRDLLDSLDEGEGFHEASFFPQLIRNGRRKLIKIPGCGIHHYYVGSLGDYFAKRRYTMVNYMLRKEEYEETWEGKGLNLRMAWAIFYHMTLVGPLLEGLGKALYHKDGEWLLHPVASAISTTGNITGMVDYWKMGSREQRKMMSVKLHRHATDSGDKKSD